MHNAEFWVVENARVGISCGRFIRPCQNTRLSPRRSPRAKHSNQTAAAIAAATAAATELITLPLTTVSPRISHTHTYTCVENKYEQLLYCQEPARVPLQHKASPWPPRRRHEQAHIKGISFGEQRRRIRVYWGPLFGRGSSETVRTCWVCVIGDDQDPVLLTGSATGGGGENLLFGCCCCVLPLPVSRV